jgi:hypothetical protein
MGGQGKWAGIYDGTALKVVPNPYEDDESYPTDLLTDLMHLYGREEFNNALRMAEIHYEAELTGKD